MVDVTGSVRPTARFRAELDRQNISYAELSDQAGVSKALVGFVANGQQTSYKSAKRMADALKVPIQVLFQHPNGDAIGGF